MPARVIGDIDLCQAATSDISSPDLPPPTMATQEPIVISGISGRFPESDSIIEFKENLLNGVDMVTENDRRWPTGLHGLPARSGKLKDISKFDASFFGVHPKQANSMDPQLRLMLEVTYEAIVDAGINPQSVRGSRTGVFIGASASECHDAWSMDPEKIVGYEMTGCTRSMFSNRLSFFFDFKGPSYTVDTACSSSLLALDQAFNAIRLGLCDSAIVGGCNLCLKPQSTQQFQKLGMLSPDGACKSFDASGNGYVRSEAVVAVFLQKADSAHRIYATMVHSKNNSDGNKEQGITFPSGAVQQQLLNEIYCEAGVDPAQVAYVECHGTGTKAGDPQEVNSIVDVFCKKGRQQPLLIGSTKSNMGHPEPASGLAALAKVIIGMEAGCIPGNLHYTVPNPDIPALADGRLQVVSENTPWKGGYVGINSFGFGGSNVHVVIKSPQNTSSVESHPASKVPRLLTFAGRTVEAVEHVFDEQHKDPENIAVQNLLQANADVSTMTHGYRGYTLLNMENKVQEIQKCTSEERPVWFVFAGMGTQWHGMGRDLMSLEVFHKSIERSDSVLSQYGIKLVDLIMSEDDSIFNDTLNSFVSIAAIQVALVDVLKCVGIEPNGIVGHSVGELGCAYADGGLTASETVLAAYWRGRCVQEANLPPGGMAAVGLTWAEAKQRCPEGVVPACHNAIDTVTISGPAETVSEFVAELQKEGVFAKEVKSAGVAFHSYYMAKTAPALLAALQKVITVPRPRSKRWVSSSIPEDRWETELARCSSAEYHVNNLVSPVLFQEALQHVPRNAITIEIAPHCLLQAILKRTLGSDCTFTGLMKRNYHNNLEFLLSNLGKLYMAGVDFSPLHLFEPVTYPVPIGTTMISPHIKWDHAISWDFATAENFAGGSGSTCSCAFDIDASPDSDDHYLVGHMIDGRVLYPATGYLVLAWRTLAKMNGQSYEQMPVAFENIHIHRATILPKTGTIKLEVNITPGSGNFEVLENGSLVVSGRVYVPLEPVLEIPVRESRPSEGEFLPLTSSDVYKELRLRGYDYGPTFQGILSANNAGDEGHLMWKDNWVSFLDTMLQIQVLSLPGRGLRLPTRIKSLRVDPRVHNEKLIQIDSERQAVKVITDKILDTSVAGGAEILGLHATVAPRRQQTQASPTKEEFHFVPYVEHNISSDDTHLKQYMHTCVSYIMHNMRKLIDNGSPVKVPNVEQFKHLASSTGIIDGMNPDGEVNEDSLLGVLKKIFSDCHSESFLENTHNTLKSNEEVLKKDMLLSNMLNARSMKTCMDVVLENSNSMKLKVIEYGVQQYAFEHIISHMSTQPMLNIDYTVVGPNVERLDVEKLEDSGIKTVKWSSDLDVPNNLGGADVLVLNNELHKEHHITESLSKFGKLIREGGFILIIEPTCNFAIPCTLENLSSEVSFVEDKESRSCGQYCDEHTWTSCLKNSGMNVVSTKSDGLLNTMFLCRKMLGEECKNQTVIDVDDLQFHWVEDVKAAMSSHQKEPPGRKIWLRVRTQPQSGIIGMINCLKQEPGGERIRCIFNAETEQITILDRDFLDLVKKDLVMNIYSQGKWGSFRHLPFIKDPTVSTEHAFVNVLTRGDLSSLRWIESPLKYFQPDHLTELYNVYYTSLNFRDIMLATGKLPPDAIPGDLANQDCILGMEFSGRDKQGHKVMGLLPAKGLATTVDADKRFVWSVPDTWSLREAASVPVVYTTVYYALVVRGQIKKGDKVLIHSGSGGVGQAAISVALHHGCEVFTTVGSEEKKNYLKTLYPQLTDKSFANSRDKSFEWDILRATNGRGVDVVLNSLSEEKLQASLRVLAQHGRFLEIGKFDLSNNTPLGMSVFLKNISFHGILLDALFEEGNAEWEVVSKLLTEGIRNGAVRPLKTTLFDKEDIEAAFRYMAQGKHIGKVVIQVREEESVSVTKASPVNIKAIPRTTCHPNKTYVITGGLGGFGLELTHWLISRGARKLVLTSRSGVRSGYQSRCLRVWREEGVNVSVSTHDVSRLDNTRKLLEDAQTIGPIGGIFHLAMVLRDGFMENQTTENFIKVGESKVAGTHNLDRVSRDLCSASLDWFVAFSSVSCGRGNAGQANYGFANSVMERICEQRKLDGHSGLAIQWGAIGDVGIVLDTMGNNDTVIGGTLPQRIISCLSTLDVYLNQSHPVMSSIVLAERKKTKSDSGGKGNLVDSVAHILGVKDATAVNPDTTLGDLGLDSLMAVEVKQTLERDYDLILDQKEIRMLTVNKLKDIASSVSTSATANVTADTIITKPRSGSVGTINKSAVSVRYDPQKLMPTEKILKMTQESVTNNEGSPLFLVHPIEGVTLMLENLASRLTCPVYGLQCTADMDLHSMSSLADSYIKIMQGVQPNGPYRLAGYSFGCTVAFEMGLQLEKCGQKVSSLYMLDGSHAFVAAHTHQARDKLSAGGEPELESEALCIFTLQFVNADYAKLFSELVAKQDFESRIDHTINYLKSHYPELSNREELVSAAKSFYSKLRIADKYVPDGRLSVPVTLIKAAQGHKQAKVLGDDYGLTKVVSKPVDIHVVHGDHETFILGDNADNVAALIK